MKDFSGYSGAPGAQGGETRPICRIAYTLNNRQPVACTLIGTQPIFYMGEMDDMGDDGASSAESRFLTADIDALEHEISMLREEIMTLDRLSRDFGQAANARYEEFMEDRALITKTPFAAPDDLEDVLNILRKSRMAAAYLDFAETHGLSIGWSRQIPGAAYECAAQAILINPDAMPAERLLLLARELRRHWQHRQGAQVNPMMFHPDDAVLIHRMQTADLAYAMVRVAWELQLSGHKESWDYIENSAMADLGRAFAREAYLDFRTLNNGQAAAAVVETWFLSERCRIVDRGLVRQMLCDECGYVFQKTGQPETASAAVLSAIGAMPYGHNYLTAHVQTILKDPIFTEVRDRSNANFLWFIKFERSCRATEDRLQNEGVRGNNTPQPEAPSKALSSPVSDASVPPASHTAEILFLFGGPRSGQPAGSRKSGHKHKSGRGKGKTGLPCPSSLPGAPGAGSGTARIYTFSHISAD